jgi:hypothetical protein
VTPGVGTGLAKKTTSARNGSLFPLLLLSKKTVFVKKGVALAVSIFVFVGIVVVLLRRMRTGGRAIATFNIDAF